MQRKTGQKEPNQMDMTKRHPPIKVMPYTDLLNPIDRAKLIFPIFGGTSPEGATGSSGGTGSDDSGKAGNTGSSQSSQSSQSSASAGGDGSAQTDSQLADLLSQVADLNSKLADQATRIQGYEQKEQEETRKSQTREQNLENDLNTANQTIDQMNSVIQYLAIENAINGFKDGEWHSSRQVFAELRDGGYQYEVDVDLESGTATVRGIEDALKKIAKDSPWLVAKSKTQAPTQQTRNGTRASGSVPSASTQASGDAARREALIERFPAIGGSRSRVSSR